ncbi:MAG: hypothetical protein V4596_00830 [Bdellovibrionota bacterium]
MNKIIFTILLLAISPWHLAYSNETCASIFYDRTELMYSTLKVKNEFYGKSYELYLKVIKKHPYLERIFTRDQILEILLQEEMPSRSEALVRLIKNLSKVSVASLNKGTLTTALKRNLKGMVPAETIPARVEKFLNGVPNSLGRLLGDMTLKEVQLLTYGKNPLKPSPESLLGQYIAETGAQSIVTRFSLGPNRKNFGESRLVVAVSRSSFAKYLEFFKKTNFLIHVHTPHQGTLHVAQNGLFGSYGRLQYQFRFPRIGTIMPHILLSTTEANRSANFFKLGTMNEYLAQHPWELKSKDDVSYCARSGYSSCTHWFGNIPIGDKTVDGYKFPGRVDEHADSEVPTGRQYKKLVPYDVESMYAETAKLVQLVWKTPGNEQLASVLGLERQNVAGEFASPGFVAVSLTAAAPVERVPVVFLITQNHQAEIKPDFDPSIHAY